MIEISSRYLRTQVLGKYLFNFFAYSHVKNNESFKRNIENLFLPISFNVCFGCSNEPSQ